MTTLQLNSQTEYQNFNKEQISTLLAGCYENTQNINQKQNIRQETKANLGKRQRKNTEALSTNSELSSKQKCRKVGMQDRVPVHQENEISQCESSQSKSQLANRKQRRQNHHDSYTSEDDNSEASGSRDKRLIQNRKSAMKCRLKKKAEFENLKIQLSDIKNSNVELNIQLQNTYVLYQDKLKENEKLKEKLDALQSQQTMMLAYVLSQQSKSQRAPAAQPSLSSFINTDINQNKHSPFGILQSNLAGDVYPPNMPLLNNGLLNFNIPNLANDMSILQMLMTSSPETILKGQQQYPSTIEQKQSTSGESVSQIHLMNTKNVVKGGNESLNEMAQKLKAMASHAPHSDVSSPHTIKVDKNFGLSPQSSLKSSVLQISTPTFENTVLSKDVKLCKPIVLSGKSQLTAQNLAQFNGTCHQQSFKQEQQLLPTINNKSNPTDNKSLPTSLENINNQPLNKYQ